MNDKLKKIEKLRVELSKKTVICFTMDIDWASEYVIKQSLDYFHGEDIPLTVFLTHHSELLKKELSSGKIKGGLHPNFLPDSSQGGNFDEVIDYCFSLLPNARAFRAHRYFDVNDTIDKLYDKGIKYESNICTYLDTIPPFLHRSGMVGFPIFLEDGGYLYQNGSLDYKDIIERVHTPGLKVINFHPMHFAMNTPYFSYTRDIKDKLSREEYNNLGEDEIKKIKWNGRGISDFLMEAVSDIKKSCFETAYMDDIYSMMDDI